MRLLILLLERILKRPVAIDSRMPLSVLVPQALGMLIGLLRGMLLARRVLLLGRGAHISGVKSLHLGGGLVRVGEYCRVECASREGVHLGRNFKLGAFSRIIASGTIGDLGKGICIGDNVGIGEFAYIGGAGGVEIGADTIVGQYFSVHPENHVFSDLDRVIRDQGVSRLGIRVGTGCWIGAKVTLTDGVTVGSGCVVAAGSVVTKSFPNNSVIGGVPARLLYSRSDMR